jgi:hypothetical protein
MCLEILDRDGCKTNNGNVWSLDTKTMAIIYDTGHLVVQNRICRTTVWDDKYGGACRPLGFYYKILEARLILERLAGIPDDG